MENSCDSFQSAVARFQASLTPTQQREFRVCSLQDVTDAIRDIDRHWSSQRKQRNMNRIAKFLEAMTQLSKVVEVFLNADVTVAFVWAPIKFVLLVSMTAIKHKAR